MFINSDIHYCVHVIPPSDPVPRQASSSSFQLHKLFHDNLLPSMHRTSAWPLENSQQMFCQHLPFVPFLLHVPLFQLLPLTPRTFFILLLALIPRSKHSPRHFVQPVFCVMGPVRHGQDNPGFESRQKQAIFFLQNIQIAS